jgi:hypothetical protein
MKELAAFLREYLKQDRDAITLIMPRSLVKLLYELAKEKADHDQVLSQSENKGIGA